MERDILSRELPECATSYDPNESATLLSQAPALDARGDLPDGPHLPYMPNGGSGGSSGLQVALRVVEGAALRAKAKLDAEAKTLAQVWCRPCALSGAERHALP